MLLQIKIIRNKSGVSGMVGYVLLIGIVMAIGTFMYVFLQSYVPVDEVTCPDGAAVSVLSYACEQETSGNYKLDLNLKNTGRFDLAGYSIYATNNIGQKIATNDLSVFLKLNSFSQKSGAQSVFFNKNGMNLRGFSTSDKCDQNFSGIPYEIFSVDITPIMEVETKKNRVILVNCGDSKIKENIVCS